MTSWYRPCAVDHRVIESEMSTYAQDQWASEEAFQGNGDTWRQNDPRNSLTRARWDPTLEE